MHGVEYTALDAKWNIASALLIHCEKHNTTVYPKKYAHGFCFAVLCCGYTLTDFPISIRLTSLALWQSNDCPSASKATLMNMDKYFMWIHYERLYNHDNAKHNKTVCIFLGIYCIYLFHDGCLLAAFVVGLLLKSSFGSWKRTTCNVPGSWQRTVYGNEVLKRITRSQVLSPRRFARSFVSISYRF